MTRFLVLGLLGAGVCVLTGCATMEGLLSAIEPMIDAGAKIAADSAGASAELAIKEHGGKFGEMVADQWTGGEITATVSSVILGAYAALKAGAFAWNRDPKPKKGA